jgi:hypothetical protein
VTGKPIMPDRISARAIEAGLGVVYLLLAAIALARAPTPLAVMLALGMMLGAYLTARTIPDIHVGRGEILRVCGVGLVVMLAGVVADIAGGSHALGWASVVMAYCAGNRFRASGIGRGA